MNFRRRMQVVMRPSRGGHVHATEGTISRFSEGTNNAFAVRKSEAANVSVGSDSVIRRCRLDLVVLRSRSSYLNVLRVLMNFGIGSLLPRTRNSRTSCGKCDRELRIQKGHWSHKVASGP